MNIIQRIFREKATSIIFTLGLAVSCFILINVSILVNKIDIHNKVYNSYENIIGFDIWCSEFLYEESQEDDTKLTLSNYLEKIVCKMSETESGNAFLDVRVHLNNRSKTYDATIIVKTNEKLNIECIDTYDRNIRNGILVGENLLDYAEYNGKELTLNIGGNSMPIVGVLENNMAGGVDTSLYIFWENCDESVKEYLNYESANERLAGAYKSKSDISAEYTNFKAYAENIGFNVKIEDVEYYGDYNNYLYVSYNVIFMAGALIFSILNCFVVSNLWLTGRKNELAIRKAYGYNMGQIAGLIFADIAKLCAPAFLTAVVSQIIYNCFCGESLLKGEMLLKVLIVMSGMLLITLITLIHLLDIIRRKSTATILTKAK